MTDPLDAIRRLRRFTEADHDDPDAEWIAAGLGRCLEGESFRDAFGLHPGVDGQHSAVRVDRLNRRDEAIREIYVQRFGDIEVKDAARNLEAVIKGEIHQPDLWKALTRAAEEADLPMSARQLERILMGSRT